MYPLKTLAGGARHQLSHYVKIILVCLEGMAYNFISFSRMNDAPLERGIISSYESHIYKHILLLLMMLVCIDLVFGIKMRILYPVEN